ncbi:hypothetical protein WISP_127908 [Willisornis vidua]|uniref:PX domain-containing protein n=1 Tax=Willisornis vidua TaxID=1566151 RepID=A0ABQ9CW95_9PASS|nr:hypothetical protein WISP_127908 [Willisornis vidua]
MGVLVAKKLDVTQQRALAAQKANHVLICIQSSVGRREGSLPLCCGETPPAVLHSALQSPKQEGHGPVGASPEEGHKGDPRAGAPLQAERIGIDQPGLKRIFSCELVTSDADSSFNVFQLATLEFPPKKLFGNKDERVIAERRSHLEKYLRSFFSAMLKSPSSPLHIDKVRLTLSKYTICEFSPFFRKGVFDYSSHGTS